MANSSHKYKAARTEAGGIAFASKREAAVYSDLRMRERAGEISGLTTQPPFEIMINGQPVRSLPDKRGRRGRPIKYVADFAFSEGAALRVVDVKGMDTPVSRLKRALVWHIYGVEVEVWR